MQLVKKKKGKKRPGYRGEVLQGGRDFRQKSGLLMRVLKKARWRQ